MESVSWLQIVARCIKQGWNWSAFGALQWLQCSDFHCIKHVWRREVCCIGFSSLCSIKFTKWVSVDFELKVHHSYSGLQWKGEVTLRGSGKVITVLCKSKLYAFLPLFNTHCLRTIHRDCNASLYSVNILQLVFICCVLWLVFSLVVALFVFQDQTGFVLSPYLFTIMHLSYLFPRSQGICDK